MSHASLLAEISAKIPEAMGYDRFMLRRRVRSMHQASDAGKPIDRNLDRLLDQLQQSIELRAKRKSGVPDVHYDETLPITSKVAEIQDAIGQHSAVIVCGETGSGKSTQLPKICLQMGRGVDGLIGHTQPRRIAARSVAERLAEELGKPLGRDVGFKVRFTDTTRPETYVKLMTDGILLSETQGDRFLNQYDTIIIDEAHERSLNIDFLMGYIRRLLDRRPELRLIITSATIDAERFAEHFGDQHSGKAAPIIEVSGRAYPVEIRYRPLDSELDEDEELGQDRAIANAVEELAGEGGGDMLVFLPTERDIRETAKTLRGRSIPGDYEKTEILPLYARLSAKEQHKVFEPHKHRRVVLATNVAESSLTVPGIRYVIDSGTARVSRYSPRRKVQRLPIEPISRASADQRSGRCGRIGPGICIRLFGEDDYLARDRYTTPEIRRTNLASVILQTKALKLGAIEQFPFLEPPRADAIRDGYKTLFELGAIDADRELTDIGRTLSRLPVDPRIGRMVLAAAGLDCLDEILVIAAALEIQDPRERPVDKQQAADEAHAKFSDESSDFLSYVKLWDFFHDMKEKVSRNQLRKVCRQNFLSFNRMREWQDIHRQLKQLVGDVGLRIGRKSPVKGGNAAKQDRRAKPNAKSNNKSDRNSAERYNTLHQALLTGLLSNVAYRTDTYEYTGAGGHKFHLWPGSGVFGDRPLWIVASELIETTRNYARTVARIQPDWIEPIAEHLVNRNYSEPHWSRRQGSAMAYERVSLFGLPIVQKRRVRYGAIDPDVSRQLMIQDGLVRGGIDLRAEFFRNNCRLAEELEKLAAKSRRNDLFIEEARLVEFYDKRLPADIHDVVGLKKWLKRTSRRHANQLCMTRDDLLPADAGVAEDEFPTEFVVAGMRLPLEYRFEPGHEEDGITLVLPKAALNQVERSQLGWLAPGLLEQKIIALIRSLPKSVRRNFVPAPDVAKKVVRTLRFGEGPFLESVADALRKVCGESLRTSDFRTEKLPPHLQMNVRVVDDRGAPVTSGRDFDQLRRELSDEAATVFAELRSDDWNREGIVAWDFGDLPERVSLDHGGVALTGYPALVDRGESVSLRLADSMERAELETRRGLRRLFCIAEKNELRGQVAWLPNLDQIKLWAATICGSKQLELQLETLLAERAFLAQGPLPRNQAEFQERRLAGRKRIPSATQEITRVIEPLWRALHQWNLAIEDIKHGRWPDIIDDINSQLEYLTSADFLISTPWEWLKHYPRYLQAGAMRLEKLRHGSESRDRQSLSKLQPFWNDYLQRARDHRERGIIDPRLEYFRWMIEEFRVSLFAQELGTSLTVSAKRLEKQWAKTRE